MVCIVVLTGCSLQYGGQRVANIVSLIASNAYEERVDSNGPGNLQPTGNTLYIVHSPENTVYSARNSL